ncbi:MAG: zinc metalloprotease [Rhodospirillaceae bacterium]|nr:MAG: zinc metalloprotease [Rhodospirillaceae bacterium]
MDYVLASLMYALSFLVVLTIIVFVHEGGHYIAARYNGVRVEVFSVGFGREVFGRTDRHGTRWKFSLIPLGGYIKMFGELENPEAGQRFSPEERAVSFRHKRLDQRAVIVAAGPIMNVVFAVVVFALVFMTLGRPLTPPVVGEVQPGSAAAAGGVQPGDRFLAIDDRAIEQFGDIRQFMLLSTGVPMAVRLQRGERELVLVLTPQVMETTDELGSVRRLPVLGVKADPEVPVQVRRYTPVAAVGEALYETYDVMRSMAIAFGQMLTGTRGADELSGLLRIAHLSGVAVQNGVSVFIMFIGILSINLGMVNLFPIPVLDGGHLLFYTIEGIRGRPLTERTQEYGLRIGLALVLGLVLFAQWNDLVFYWSGVRSFLVGLVS